MIIKGDIKTIPFFCFFNTPLEKIVLPESIETIEPYAFWNCKNLKSIVIPENVKTIADYAFAGSGIEDVIIPEGVDTIYCCAFYNCQSLKSVEIDTSSVGELMFSYCSNLENVVFSNNVKVISTNAFLNCDSIKEITIPSSVTEITEHGGFDSCMSLTKVTYEGSVIPCQIGQHLILKEITVKENSDWETKFSNGLKSLINSGEITLIKIQ